MDSVNPHPTDEDPEEHMGAEIMDPWDDPTQLDWPNGEVEIDLSEEVSD